MLKILSEWTGRWIARTLTLMLMLSAFVAFLRMLWQLADWVADTLIISGLVLCALNLTAQAVEGLKEHRQEVRRG